jgi:hypothetical protein
LFLLHTTQRKKRKKQSKNKKMALQQGLLKEDIKRFLGEIKQKKEAQRIVFKRPGALAEFLNRQAIPKANFPKGVEHEVVPVTKETTVPFSTYLRLREPAARQRARKQLAAQRRPKSRAAVKRARLRRLLA